MKQLLVSALTSLFCGLAFALGLVVVTLNYESWSNSEKELHFGGEWVNLPPELSIQEHHRVPGTPQFTVQGVVANGGASTWNRISIEARILASGAQVNECTIDIAGETKPGARRAFQLECYNVAGDGIPENVTYELRVHSAQRRS